jgi:signal transduction histidine kinase
LEVAFQTASAIGSSLEQEAMLKDLLERLHRFFEGTTLCVLTYDEGDNSLKFAPGTLVYYKVTNPAYRHKHHFPLNEGSLACAVAKKALKSGRLERENVPDVHERAEYLGLIAETQSELCISLMTSDKKLLGVLVLERQHKFGFDEDDEALIETIAQQLSMGLELFRQREQVSFSRNVSTLMAWAADMAHEINNEAFKIQTFSYLIKERPTDHEAVSTYADSLMESARKLADSTPRGAQGRGSILLDAAITKYTGAIARQQNIELQFLPGAEQVCINANQLQFQQVLRHLIRNASRAMSSKKRKKMILRTGIIPEENLVELQFQDFGPGVLEKVRPSLFQTNITTKSQGGYGLLISRLLVEEMGGTIRLLPKEPGKGAVFSIKLPIAKFNGAGAE